MIRVLLVVAILAALVYGLVWVIERRRSLGSIRPRSKPKMVAPDDDEDFLRSLRREEPSRPEPEPEPEPEPNDDEDFLRSRREPESEQEQGDDEGPDVGGDKGEKRP